MTKANKHLLYLAAAGIVWYFTRPKASTPTLGRAPAAVTPVSIWTEGGELRTPWEINTGQSMSPEAARLLTDTEYRVNVAKQYQAARMMKRRDTTGKGGPNYLEGYQRVREITALLKEAGLETSNVATWLSGERQPVMVRQEI